MITRIVKLHLKQETVPEFLTHFETIRHKIRSVEGCLHLELHSDIHEPGIFFTYSIWNTAHDLEEYTASVFFKSTWSVVKPLFAAPAEAWSLQKIEKHNDIHPSGQSGGGINSL